MRFEPSGAALGAHVFDINLARPLSDDERGMLLQAFAEYQVLSFPDQQLSPENLIEIAGYFGRVARYPYAADLAGYPGVTEVIKEKDDTVNFGGVWHSDTTYTKTPPIASLLYARTVPSGAGDTLFANMYTAWESLSSGMQSLLEPLMAINTSQLRSSSGSNMRGKFKRSMAVKNTERADLTGVHPVARVHPDTGRRALYVNSAHTKQFVGMTEAESEPLLAYLFKHLKQAELCYQHHWEPDMLTLWDNRCTQHYAVNDYHGQRRVMHRVTIEERV